MGKHNITPAEIRGIAPVVELGSHSGDSPEVSDATPHDTNELPAPVVISMLSAATRTIPEEERLESSRSRHPSVAGLHTDKPAP